MAFDANAAVRGRPTRRAERVEPANDVDAQIARQPLLGERLRAADAALAGVAAATHGRTELEVVLLEQVVVDLLGARDQLKAVDLLVRVVAEVEAVVVAVTV